MHRGGEHDLCETQGARGARGGVRRVAAPPHRTAACPRRPCANQRTLQPRGLAATGSCRKRGRPAQGLQGPRRPRRADRSTAAKRLQWADRFGHCKTHGGQVRSSSPTGTPSNHVRGAQKSFCEKVCTLSPLDTFKKMLPSLFSGSYFRRIVQKKKSAAKNSTASLQRHGH